MKLFSPHFKRPQSKQLYFSKKKSLEVLTEFIGTKNFRVPETVFFHDGKPKFLIRNENQGLLQISEL